MKTKRNNVAKKLGIASLCLATLVSAFSGIASFKTAGKVIAEDATTSVWSDFITTSEGATVSTDGGLIVSSVGAYEASFNQIFYGNIELRFAFPERHVTATSSVWGDFKFRITDATDESNFFDIVYEVGKNNSGTKNGTILKVVWNNHTIQCNNAATTYDYTAGDYIYDGEGDGRDSYLCSPSFMGLSATRGTRTGRLTLKWGAAGTSDVLWVTTNGPQKSSDKYSVIAAKFDGSYDETATNNGFVNKSKWGLPKMEFPNGYKISFSSDTGSKDATDVRFTSIVNNGTTSSKAVVSGGTTTTSFTETSYKENNYIKAYKAMEANAGKTLIGWKDADGALYPMLTALKASDMTVYTPVFLGFNKIPGASLRIDTAGGQSGLRFITGFNSQDNYQDLMAAGYITSYGTLLAYTDALDERNLTIAYYGDNTADEAGQKILKVPSTQKMFDYMHQGVSYRAYSVALVNPNISYSQSFTARGYLEVKYADESTQIFYTNVDARSIEQTAYNLMTLGEAEFNTYGPQQKEIVRTYAAALLPAEE